MKQLSDGIYWSGLWVVIGEKSYWHFLLLLYLNLFKIEMVRDTEIWFYSFISETDEVHIRRWLRENSAYFSIKSYVAGTG